MADGAAFGNRDMERAMGGVTHLLAPAASLWNQRPIGRCTLEMSQGSVTAVNPAITRLAGCQQDRAYAGSIRVVENCVLRVSCDAVIFIDDVVGHRR